MAEAMTEQQLMFHEKKNTGTTWTRNKEFYVQRYQGELKIN